MVNKTMSRGVKELRSALEKTIEMDDGQYRKYYDGSGSRCSKAGAEIVNMWMSDPLDDCNEGKQE